MQKGSVDKVDDLISRKALMEGRAENDPVRIAAMCAETAFDKEEVIEELKGEIELCVTHPLYPGRYIKKNRAVEIVKKGGIE